MTKKEIAAKFRELARNAERIEAAAMQVPALERASFGCDGVLQSTFTCNAVGAALGRKIRDQYEALFFSRDGRGDELDLWHAEDCPSIRVVLLCLAAAMVETGDLLTLGKPGVE